MNLKELDRYKLNDAVNFHEELNPALWDGDHMRPDVRKALLRIAADFQEFLGVQDLAIADVRVSGSNAAYSYTPHSDIDLHLIVDFDQLNNDDVYQELFNAKKFQYNQEHNIKVRGFDVELYVQDINQPHASLGEYSVARKEWTRIPTKQRANLDDFATRQKYDKLKGLVMAALASKKLSMVEDVTDIIKRYRRAGLADGGEFSPENLAFKMLRTQGYIGRLWKHRAELEDLELSLENTDFADIRDQLLGEYGLITEMRAKEFTNSERERLIDAVLMNVITSNNAQGYDEIAIIDAVEDVMASGKIVDVAAGVRAALNLLQMRHAPLK